ncbi:MAG TPA: M50 family metallopeptidase [Armatimonadota bacterium]
MEQFTGGLGILLIFGAIIAIHEFGHFVSAKLSGMGVHEFSLGFGPALFKREYHGTLYAIRIIPLGGYVRIAGMEPGDEDAPNGYNTKPFFAKFITLAAGATMNFILAFVVIIVLGMAIGAMKPGNKVLIDGIIPNSPASRVDLRTGDELVSVAGVQPLNQDQARAIIGKSTQPVPIVVRRGDRLLTVTPTPKQLLTPEPEVSLDIPLVGKVPFILHMTTTHIIGVQLTMSSGQWERLNLADSLKVGTRTVVGTVVSAAGQFISVVSGRVPVSQLSGPVGIMNLSYKATRTEHISHIWFSSTFTLMAMLSIFIGFFNLLPIPALDGGRIFFLIIEGIRRKPLAPEKEAKIHAIGMAVLLGLVLLVTIKDVWNLFGG